MTTRDKYKWVAGFEEIDYKGHGGVVFSRGEALTPTSVEITYKELPDRDFYVATDGSFISRVMLEKTALPTVKKEDTSLNDVMRELQTIMKNAKI
jgi:hypothetical protein